MPHRPNHLGHHQHYDTSEMAGPSAGELYGTIGTGESVPDENYDLPPGFLETSVREILEHLQGIAAWAAQARFPVDEKSSKTLTAASESVLIVQPTYEFSEIITSILVVGPATTAFSLQLGKSAISLLTNASGFCLISPIQMSLDRTDDRILNSGTAGDWYLRLMGYGDVRPRRA